jgi:ATP-dependent protease ClpP protease subunit
MDKQTLISIIEGSRKSRLITYITGDRQPFTTRIAEDTIPILNRHLENLAPTERLSLFLYTRGGDLVTPLKLVKLIKSYCKEFEVLIPYRAHSAGTLIALGADKIVMGRLAELSPVDPTTMHPFNPPDPSFPQRKLEISAEDLNSYFLLAKEMAKIKEEQTNEPLKYLAERIHPLSLGNAYRVYRMGKMVAEKLLELHMNRETEEKKIKRIIKEITGEILCIHGYPINRDEAGRMGLKVEIPDKNLEKDFWDLYEIYAKEMKLDVPFHPSEFLGDKEIAEVKYTGAYIESDDLSDQFIFKGKVQKTIRDNKPAIDMHINSQKWEQIK